MFETPITKFQTSNKFQTSIIKLKGPFFTAKSLVIGDLVTGYYLVIEIW